MNLNAFQVEADRAQKRQRRERERQYQEANQAAEDSYVARTCGQATAEYAKQHTKQHTKQHANHRPARLHEAKPFEPAVPYESSTISEGPFLEAVVTNAPTGKLRSELEADFSYFVGYKDTHSDPQRELHKVFAVARRAMTRSEWTTFFETPDIRESPLVLFLENLESYKQTALRARNGGYFNVIIAQNSENNSENNNDTNNNAKSNAKNTTNNTANDNRSETSEGDEVPDIPFRAARINVYNTYLPWNKMQSKLKYVANMQHMGAHPSKNYFRVYAYTDQVMRLSGWRNIFQGTVYVEKINGRFNDDEDFCNRLKKGQLAEWGVRPFKMK